MLGVDKSTVSDWHSGNKEPSDDNWAKLLALEEQLEATGKLNITTTSRENSANSGKLFGDGKPRDG